MQDHPLASPRLLLAAVMLAGGLAVLYFTRGVEFLGDEWGFFGSYPGYDLGLILEPRVGHLQVVPITLYKVWLELFGPSSIAFRLLLVGLLWIVVGLLFVLIRKRVGEWFALGACTLVMVYGSGGEALGSTLGITVLLAIAFGLGSLVALERDDPAGDVIASILILAGLISYGPALAFLAAGIIWVVFVRTGERASLAGRAWIVAIPFVLYGIWRLAKRHAPGSPEVTLDNLLTMPASLIDSFASALASMSGLIPAAATPPSLIDVDAARVLVPLAIAAVVLLVLARRKHGLPFDRKLLVFAALPPIYWAAIAAVSAANRPPEAARYQLLSAILLMLLFAELGKGLPVRRWVAASFAGLLLVGIGSNLIALRDFGTHFRANSAENRAQLAAVELTADTIPPEFIIEAPGETSSRIPDLIVPAGEYLDGVDRYGSVAPSIDELRKASQRERSLFDEELTRIYALGFADEPTGANAETDAPEAIADAGVEATSDGSCTTLTPVGPGGNAIVTLPEGGITVEARTGPEATYTLARLADRPIADIPAPLPGRPQLLAPPPDSMPDPWRVQIGLRVPIEVCAA